MFYAISLPLSNAIQNDPLWIQKLLIQDQASSYYGHAKQTFWAWVALVEIETRYWVRCQIPNRELDQLSYSILSYSSKNTYMKFPWYQLISMHSKCQFNYHRSVLIAPPPSVWFSPPGPPRFHFAKPENYISMYHQEGTNTLYVGGKAMVFILTFTDRGVRDLQVTHGPLVLFSSGTGCRDWNKTNCSICSGGLLQGTGMRGRLRERQRERNDEREKDRKTETGQRQRETSQAYLRPPYDKNTDEDCVCHLYQFLCCFSGLRPYNSNYPFNMNVWILLIATQFSVLMTMKYSLCKQQNIYVYSIGQFFKNDDVVYLICFTKSCSKSPHASPGQTSPTTSTKFSVDIRWWCRPSRRLDSYALLFWKSRNDSRAREWIIRHFYQRIGSERTVGAGVLT